MARELPHVRIGHKWYYQDDRLRELRGIDNPNKRITFSEFRNKGLRIDEKKTYIANFEFGDAALDVRCRFDGHSSYITNIGPAIGVYAMNARHVCIWGQACQARGRKKMTQYGEREARR